MMCYYHIPCNHNHCFMQSNYTKLRHLIKPLKIIKVITNIVLIRVDIPNLKHLFIITWHDSPYNDTIHWTHRIRFS